MPILHGRGAGTLVLPERPQLDGQAIGDQARQIADALRKRSEDVTAMATPAIASATDFLTERLEVGAKSASDLASQAADAASAYGARAARALSDVSSRGADALSGRADDAAAAVAASQAAADDFARTAKDRLARTNTTAWIFLGLASLALIVALMYRDKIRRLVEASQPYQAWRNRSDADAEVGLSDPEDDSATMGAES